MARTIKVTPLLLGVGKGNLRLALEVVTDDGEPQMLESVVLTLPDETAVNVYPDPDAPVDKES